MIASNGFQCIGGHRRPDWIGVLGLKFLFHVTFNPKGTWALTCGLSEGG